MRARSWRRESISLSQGGDEGLKGRFFRVAFETRQAQQDADLFADGGERFKLFAAEEMGLAVLDVDDPDDLIAGNDRSREEGFVLVFGELGEGLEAGVKIGFFGDGDEAALAGHPAGETFAQVEVDFAEGAGCRVIGRTKDEFLPVEEVEQAGVTAHELRNEGVDGLENILEGEFLDHQAADFLKEPELLLGSLELAFEVLYLRHILIIAGWLG
jgi:hypothetical protein